MQVISQVDHTFYWKPENAKTVEALTGTVVAEQPVDGTVTFQCYWDSICNVVAQDTEVQQSVTYTTGVTTSDSDQKTFGMQFGVEADIIPGIGASLSASFSESETHTVALAVSRGLTRSFKVLPNTTLQVWQLHAQYIAEYDHDGQTYRYTLESCGSGEEGVILALTYPETAGAATG
jgi:hypothetical protein